MYINAVCWFTLLAAFGVVMPTFIMLRVNYPTPKGGGLKANSQALS